ncbi:hypothetical protein [Pandoraea bronchicola]|uniref:hypothetical protein n=1 Tax=Pandoraea bronchicola TaxID=2508287 RepID=UPI001581CF14|nr:hypothetical protein [Pandoraea bronchicola]
MIPADVCLYAPRLGRSHFERRQIKQAINQGTAGVLNSEASLSLAKPIEDDDKTVGVMAFFRNPGKQVTWKCVISFKKRCADTPLKLQLCDRQIDQMSGEDHATDSQCGIAAE